MSDADKTTIRRLLMPDEVGMRRVLLLASYCGDDDPACTDSVPCRDCLEMCNIVDVRGTIVTIHGGLDFARERGVPPILEYSANVA